MLNNVKSNLFIKLFQEHYEKLISNHLSHEISHYIKDLINIDDEEIIHYMINELGNTLTIYTSKLKSDRIQVITLEIEAPEDEYFIPSIILASAYESFTIKKVYSTPAHPLLPKADNMYNQLILGKTIFSQFGGCDIDMVSDALFGIISLPDIAKSDLLQQIQTLVIIKILELLQNAIVVLMEGDRFKQLPKNQPFAFFAHLDQKEYITIATSKSIM